MALPLRVESIYDMSGGLFDTVTRDRLPSNALSIANNLRYLPSGGVRKRPGTRGVSKLITTYNSFDVNVQNGQSGIIGNGTAWALASNGITRGDAIYIAGVRYVIQDVINDTNIQIYPAYQGVTANNVSYRISSRGRGCGFLSNSNGRFVLGAFGANVYATPSFTGDDVNITWTTTVFTGAAAVDWSFEQFGDTIYFSSDSAAPRSWTGAGASSALAAPPPNNCLFFKRFWNRMLAFVNTTLPRRLYYSAILDPTDFTTTGNAGFVDVTESNEDPIRGGGAVGDHFVVFGLRSVWLLIYTGDRVRFQKRNLTREFGCIAGRSVRDDGEGGLIFLTADRGWMRIRSDLRFENLSWRIMGTVRDANVWSRDKGGSAWGDACGVTFEGAHVVSYDNDVESLNMNGVFPRNNTFGMFDMELNSTPFSVWVPENFQQLTGGAHDHNLRAADFVVAKDNQTRPRCFYVDAGEAMLWELTRRDMLVWSDGSRLFGDEQTAARSYAFTVEPGMQYMGGAFYTKRFERLWIHGDINAAASADITVQYRKDTGTQQTVSPSRQAASPGEILGDGTPSVDRGTYIDRMPIDYKGYAVAPSVIHQSSTVGMTLHGIVIVYRIENVY